MYELIPLSPRCYVIESPARVGLVRLEEDRVCLIDSGSDQTAGRKIRQLLDANGWKLAAIYNTHSNADHIGGNRYLQAQTGCAIYAPGMECPLANYPILSPALLYGGCPPAELRHKFLLAQPSRVLPLTPEVLPEGMELVPLPGHFLDMAGFRAPDGVVYLADCLCSEATLEKYRISFLYDVGAYLDTLERVQAMEGKIFVPAHAPHTGDIAPLAKANIRQVERVAEDILALCARPITQEELLAALFRRYGLTMTFEQHALVGSTLRSYLTWLKEQGRATARIADNRLLWQAVRGPAPAEGA